MQGAIKYKLAIAYNNKILDKDDYLTGIVQNLRFG